MDELALTDVSPESARPESLKVDFYDQGDILAIHKKRGEAATGIHYMLLIWTPICIYVLVAVLSEPSTDGFIFGTALGSIWILMIGYVVWTRFGKETLVLHADRAVFLRTALVTLKKRVVPTKDIRVFRECHYSIDVISHVYYGVEMSTFEKPLKCFFHLGTQEREWLIYQLNHYLGIEPADFEQLQHPLLSLSTGIATIEKSLESPTEDPPLDSAWRLTIEPKAFSFVFEGGFSVAGFAGLLLVNILFYGLIAIFALTLGFWASLPLMIFFSAIGLLLLIPLIFTVLAPFTSAFWRFERSRIVSNSRYAMFTRTRTWNVHRLDRLELRQAGDEESSAGSTTEDANSGLDKLDLYDLVFVTDKQADLCCIDFITKEEAWWFAQTIYHRRPEWFESP